MTRSFEALEIGETKESHGRTVSEHDIYSFAGLEGYYGELHTNAEYASSTEYGGRIAHGGLLVVYVQGFMAGLRWDYDLHALYGFDRVRFVNPVFIGDTITAEASASPGARPVGEAAQGEVALECELVDKEVRDEETGTVTIACELVKSDGTLAMRMDWLALVRRED